MAIEATTLIDRLTRDQCLRVVRIATWQRRLNWAAAAMVLWLLPAAAIVYYSRPLYLGRVDPPMIWLAVIGPAWVVVLVTYCALLRALGFNLIWIGVLALLSCITLPTFFIPVMLVGAANDRANKALAVGGLQVGFLGLSRNRRLHLRRSIRTSVCLNCGYDLWRLPPGPCPECGEPYTPYTLPDGP